MRVGSLVMVAIGTLLLAQPATAAIEFDQNVTPEVIFGSGNTNGAFTTDRNSGIELGLRAKIPFVGTTNSNGDGTYSYSFAEQNSGGSPGKWNFDWTVNTDLPGSDGGMKIDDLTYLLRLDVDPSTATNFYEFDPITPISTLFYDHSIGTNATPNGGGTEASDAATYITLIAENNVLQQSWRYAFFSFPYDPDTAGTYTVELAAFDSYDMELARTSIDVIIGGVVPEPTAMLTWAGLALCGYVGIRRRKNRLATS